LENYARRYWRICVGNPTVLNNFNERAVCCVMIASWMLYCEKATIAFLPRELTAHSLFELFV
jgi:hypothetical protein